MADVTGTGNGCKGCPDDDELFIPVDKLKLVDIRYDENNKSLDIFLKRKELQWNNGVGIQLNNLSKSDKQALRKYLESGK